MGKVQNKQLTLNQFKLMLIGFALGPELLRLPNILVDATKQDAWISAIIGLIYPIFIVLVSSYIINKYPQHTILDVSRICFGKLIGNMLNIIYLLQFAFYSAIIAANHARILRTYIVGFMSPLKILLVIIAIALYIATRGLRVLGKTNEFITYLLVITIATSVSALSMSNIKNIMPVFGSGISNIMTSAIKTIYFYSGFEVIILFHPYVENKKNIKRAGLWAVAISGLIWVWVVFITTFFLGVDIVPKANWSFIFVFESLKFPLINNFRYVVLFGLTLVGFRVIANYIFAASFAINDLTSFAVNKVCVFISISALIASFIMTGQIAQMPIWDKISMVFACFDIVFISVTAVVIMIRKKLKLKN